MDFSEEIAICRLCLKKFTENCAPIGEAVQHSLNFLTLYPNLTVSDNSMCETCTTNLTKCFDFKVRCLSTEDCIASFAKGEDKKVDLRDIFSKVKLDGNIDGVPDDHNVCRLCLELIKDDTFMSIRHDIDLIEILQKYFLEMDLKITDDIIACTPCYNSLRLFASFVNNYMKIEQRIDEYCQVEGLNYNGQVDLRDVATFISKSCLKVEDISSSLIIKEEKPENIVDTNADVKVKFEDLKEVEQEEKLVDKGVHQENSNSFQHHPSPSHLDGEPQTSTANQTRRRYHLQEYKSHKCKVCPYETKWKRHLQKHLLTHRNAPGVIASHIMIKCDLCEYKTPRKSDLKRHMLTHRTRSEITMYKCKTCAFQSKYKDSLQKHKLTHMGVSEIEMQKCKVCPFQSKCLSTFREHLLSHRSAPDVNKCDLCDFQTKRKFDLKRHMLAHKTPLEITMYKCKMCAFQSKYKDSLQKHKLTHMDVSEIRMHKCKVCPFKTKWKRDLQEHVLTHMDVSESHKCEVCPFETKQKRDLQDHLLTHSNAPDAIAPPTINKCDLCDYKIKRKFDLKMHMATHNTRLEIAKHKCDLCDYETIRKADLKRHILVHGSTMYKCDQCDYEANQKSYLKKHMLIHKTSSPITIYKCETCAFQTKYRRSLQHHNLVHMDVSEIELHKCEMCPFKTKRKNHLRRHLLTHGNAPDVVMGGTPFCEKT